MAVHPYVSRARRGERRARQLGRAITALADSQYGVTARWQLRNLGASDDQIDRWLAAGRLIPLYRGVFAVGHRPLCVEGWWMAGVLAGGGRAVLSDRSGGDHWELTGRRRRTAHVTVPTYRRRRRGLVFHVRSLPTDEVTVHQGIPVTTVARTVFDLAATESVARVRQALAIAEERLLADSTPLVTLLERYPGHHGVRTIRATLADPSRGLANRELELRFAEFLESLPLPPPERNARVEVEGRVLVVDCLWREGRLVVELDSRKHHADWEAAERDRARDAALLAIGLSTVRVTWRRLHNERAQLATELCAAHDLRSPRIARET